jgi:hypothetical protein
VAQREAAHAALRAAQEEAAAAHARADATADRVAANAAAARQLEARTHTCTFAHSHVP